MFRHIFDKLFTVTAGLSIVLLIAVLMIILGPMIGRGLSAIIFQGTIEFRSMQLSLFERGSKDSLQAEYNKANETRKFVYQTLDKFKQDIDIESFRERSSQIYRQFGIELRYKNVTGEEYTNFAHLPEIFGTNWMRLFQAATGRKLNATSNMFWTSKITSNLRTLPPQSFLHWRRNSGA